MKTIVIGAEICPKCSQPMPGGALAGLCPACLLAQGLATEEGGVAPRRHFEPPPLEEVARLFPQLEIQSLLGAGGMGAVYKARQSSLDRVVALKILPGKGASSANFEERFNREARALARLNHPNIVAVFEFGQVGGEGGLHFFIMEFVDGANLRQLEQAGRLAPREALQIIPQICDALQYAHDEGVVHRDIKPENVLVDRKGRVKIADFGLAKILGRDTEALRLTSEGQVMGTPHYMAPEQIEKPLTVDHRADIYSLGVVLYEMLTGDLPLGKFAPPSRKYQLDVRLDDVVLRALENDPARRYQQASEVKSQVENIAGTPAPVGASPAAFATEERYLYWVGLPIVIDRDGKRTVNQKERLRAWAIVFGLLTIAFAFVSAVTGRSLMGWLGISGGASLVVRAGLAALVVAGGVRHALSQPPIPPGTVIPKPKTPWWRSRQAVLPAILLLMATWTFFQEKSSLLGLIKTKFSRAETQASQAATRDSEAGALVEKLPGGGSLVLLAVSDPDSAPDGWWHPDGTPVTNMTLEVETPRRALNRTALPNTQMKNLILLMKDLPEGTPYFPHVEFKPSSGHTGSRMVLRDGQPLASGRHFLVTFQESARATTMRIGIQLEPWRTIYTRSVDGLQNRQAQKPGDPKWTVAFSGEARETNGEVQVAYSFVGWNTKDRLWAHRLVVVDTESVEHESYRAVLGVNATYRDLPLKAMKEFRVQVRPVHWVEFPDIALHPRALLPRTTSTASAELWSPTLGPGEKPNLDKIRAEASEMMKRGEYEPALQRHIWLHNHALEVADGMTGVRLSFYLSDWVELGRRYPRAKQALIEVRDLKTREFDEGRGYSKVFQDVQSINFYLNEDDATADLFKRIHQLDQKLAVQCIHYARAALVKSREYELCLSYIPDVQADFENHKRDRDRYLADATKNPSMQAPQFRKSADARFVAEVSQLIEMLIGVGRVAEAGSIRAQAKAIVDDANLWAAQSEQEKREADELVSKTEPLPAPKLTDASLETWTPTVNPGENLDLSKLLEVARAMIAARDYESALQRFIWIHNHARKNGGDPLGGISDWIELGRRFPKAKQVLIELRDLKAYEFEKGRGYNELFQEIWIMNRSLGAEDATTRLFIRLREVDPVLARQCIWYARDALVKSKDYELCLSYIPDVQADFMRCVESRDMEKQMAAKNSFMNTPFFSKSTDARFIAGVSQLMEMLKGVGRVNEADNIRTQAIAIVDAPEFRTPAK